LGEAGKLNYLLNGKEIGSIPIYPKGSPRLKLKDNSAFSFSETMLGELTVTEKWLFNLHFLVRVLFMGRSD
jgi:D-alanyl-D-alanine carboxypeptidase